MNIHRGQLLVRFLYPGRLVGPTLWWVVLLLYLESFLLHTCSFQAYDERRGLLRAELPLFKGMEPISR